MRNDTWLSEQVASATRRMRCWRCLLRGNRLYKQGDFVEAADAYREALEYDPLRVVVRMNLGLSLYKLGDRPHARQEWLAARELCRGNQAYLAEQLEIMLRQFG
ncbi:MAG: tetratricopeptide repeat protein [Capsulimonadaceae bacterium]